MTTTPKFIHREQLNSAIEALGMQDATEFTLSRDELTGTRLVRDAEGNLQLDSTQESFAQESFRMPVLDVIDLPRDLGAVLHAVKAQSDGSAPERYSFAVKIRDGWHAYAYDSDEPQHLRTRDIAECKHPDGGFVQRFDLPAADYVFIRKGSRR